VNFAQCLCESSSESRKQKQSENTCKQTKKKEKKYISLKKRKEKHNHGNFMSADEFDPSTRPTSATPTAQPPGNKTNPSKSIRYRARRLEYRSAVGPGAVLEEIVRQGAVWSRYPARGPTGTGCGYGCAQGNAIPYDANDTQYRCR